MIHGDDIYVSGLSAFIDYVYEDKSRYPLAIDEGFVDDDKDFLIGDSGGFLMKIDFMFINTHEFTEVADFHKVHNTYTHTVKGTRAYDAFWSRETKRRSEGMTSNCKLYFTDVEEYFHPATTETRKKQLLHPLRITGDHYNYLNYGRIMRTPTAEEKAELHRKKAKAKKVRGFPRFWDGDYWNFKIDEFVAANDYHLAKCKARRKGYSFKRGSQGANTINLNPEITIILAAYYKEYLTGKGATSDMLKKNLDWFEKETYWKRGYLSQDLEELELGYRLQKTGATKYGWQSKALSVSLFNNPSAPIGKDAVEIDYEEAGKCPNLQEAVDLAMSSTEAGDVSVGTIRVYGTGGAKGADWRPFAELYYNPKANNMMPFENVWDNNARFSLCGFFHPQIQNYEPFMDDDGNSLLMQAFYRDKENKDRAKKFKPTEDYLLYIGQRANCPAEAFNTGNENLFSSAELLDHLQDLEVRERVMKYRDGMLARTATGLKFKTNAEIEFEGGTAHPFIINFPPKKEEDKYGCIREFYSPFRIDGEVPTNLYTVVIDPIGKDVEEKELTTKHSLVSIQVWMYPNNIANSTGDILVAHYIGRPTTEDGAANIAIMLCEYYNAKALPETDRGTIVADFKRAGKLHLLDRDPTIVMTNPDNMATKAPFGMNIGGGSKAEDGYIYLKQMLYEPVGVDDNGNTMYLLHYISDLGITRELVGFRKKGNFDRLACARLYAYQRIRYRTLRRKAEATTSTQGTTISNLGLYRK